MSSYEATREPDLELRGKLIRSLVSPRNLPAHLSSANAPVASPTVIAPTGNACTRNFNSVLIDGKPKALNIPAQLVESYGKNRDAPDASTLPPRPSAGQPETISQRKAQRKRRSPKLSGTGTVRAYLDKVFGFSDL